MGVKDSKLSFITYEDAVKRVSDSELRRIREAFKRCAGANGTALSLEAFVHEVLCDGVPYEVAEWLYQACGGTKRGIAFRELLCGIVVLTKGNIEEKIKFLWTLYVNNQGENGTYIYKRDFARTLHLENTSLPVRGAQKSAEILLGLFGAGEKVTFDQFRSWLLIHKDATVLSKWLLSEAIVAQDLETPTFYQSLAGVTHLEERDIIELEKCFWSLRNQAPTGQLDAESLGPLLSPPLPRAALRGLLLALDENRDGHVDFKELCCGLSAACRGPNTERLKFCFKIFDLDSDGVLNKKELIDMVGIFCTVANESLKNQGSRASTPSDETDSDGQDKGFDPEVILLNLRDKLVTVTRGGRKPVFQLGPGGEEGQIVVMKEQESEESEGPIGPDTVLTLEDFLIWAVESAENVVTPFLELLFEVCHVVLGLRPQCVHRERDIVLGWLRREVLRGYSVGQFWFLVAAEWWSGWLAYTAAGSGADGCCRAAPRHIDEAIVCDESFTSNSTESMGSLLWRAETASVGSGGSSSGVSSAAGLRPPTAPRPHPHPNPHPGPIDNKRLLAPNTLKVRTLTGEGGHLRRDVTLAQHRDFELLPDALWRALALWYGGPDPLPRQVIRPPNSDVELELYPLHLKLLRHVPSTQRMSAVGVVGVAGVGVGAGASLYSSASPPPAERQLAYTAAFSRLATVRQVGEFVCGALGLAREDLRLWALGAEAVLLNDERPTLHELAVDERTRLLLEVRNADLTWPEEIGALSMSNGSSRATERRETLVAPRLAGATGLHNLGNTCFMNAALQAVWNTGPLTRYFNSGMHLYEVNTTNPLGTKGALALRYGELCKEVWSCVARSVAPLRVRWVVARHARALSGGGQHDAQELLAWLLDALHEDLNRAHLPPAPHPHPAHAHHPLTDNDSAGRPDQVVAAEAWRQYSARNDSVMTDLFYGQLKSKVRCDTCGWESVRFDTFNMLSLPLPMENYVRCEIIVILQDGSVPVKYGVRVNSEGTYAELKKKLSELCGLAPETMLLVELSGATIGRVLEDGSKILAASATDLYAYETPHDHDDDHEDDDGHAEDDCHDHASDDDSDGDRPPVANGWCVEGESCAGDGDAEEGAGAARWAERSRSEILMSQSPPSTFYGRNTLPKQLRRGGSSTSSPTLSVRSLTLRPNAHSHSPTLGRIKFGSSPSNMCKMNELKDAPPSPSPSSCPSGEKIHYLVAVHRKQCRSESYFVGWQRSRPALFGVPLVVGVSEGMSGRDLYTRVYTQLARLLSRRPPPPPPPHTTNHTAPSNHATDCDDSLGYEFPFTLRVVSGGGDLGGGGGGGGGIRPGEWCAVCPWPKLCRGCALPTDDSPLIARTSGKKRRTRKRSTTAQDSPERNVPDTNSPTARAKLHSQTTARITGADGEGEGESGALMRLDLSALRAAIRRGGSRLMLAIDWDPTALHLRYQSNREKAWAAHRSVALSRGAALAVGLRSCLRAFTREERLDQPFPCGHCHQRRQATKKLQLWRAPPVLIIHLKRFQYVNNKWIKSQKVVNFPYQDFDPTEYLASVPQETILRHREINNVFPKTVCETISESESSDEEDAVGGGGEAGEKTGEAPGAMGRATGKRSPRGGRERLQSTSLVATPITDDNLVDYHKHHLKKDQDPFDLKYRLYAVVSHSGQMSGGHYVAYARNPSGTWLCYNDSSCREVGVAAGGGGGGGGATPAIDPASAYLLFYERQGLDYDAYLPDVAGKRPLVSDGDAPDPDENDLKKMCAIA